MPAPILRAKHADPGRWKSSRLNIQAVVAARKLERKRTRTRVVALLLKFVPCTRVHRIAALRARRSRISRRNRPGAHALPDIRGATEPRRATRQFTTSAACSSAVRKETATRYARWTDVLPWNVDPRLTEPSYASRVFGFRLACNRERRSLRRECERDREGRTYGPDANSPKARSWRVNSDKSIIRNVPPPSTTRSVYHPHYPFPLHARVVQTEIHNRTQNPRSGSQPCAANARKNVVEIPPLTFLRCRECSCRYIAYCARQTNIGP